MSRRAFLGMAAGLGAVALGGGPLRALAQQTVAQQTVAQSGRRDAAGGDSVGRVVRPNILHIMTDDQDYQSWAERFTRLDSRGKVLVDGLGEPVREYAMAFTRSMPGGGWCDFTQDTCTSAICAPSRAWPESLEASGMEFVQWSWRIGEDGFCDGRRADSGGGGGPGSVGAFPVADGPASPGTAHTAECEGGTVAAGITGKYQRG